MRAECGEVIWPMPPIEMVADLGLKYSNFFYCATLPLSGACYSHFSLTLTNSHENSTKKDLTGIYALKGVYDTLFFALLSAQPNHWKSGLFVLVCMCFLSPLLQEICQLLKSPFFVLNSHQKDVTAFSASRDLKAST